MYYYLRYRGRHPYTLVKASSPVEIRQKAYKDLTSGKYRDKEYLVWYYKGKDLLLYRESGVVYDPNRNDAVDDDFPIGTVWKHNKFGCLYSKYGEEEELPAKKILPNGRLTKI